MTAVQAPVRRVTRARHALAVALLAAVGLAIGAGGYALGRSGAPDLARARASGMRAGLAVGEAKGSRGGYSVGLASGIRGSYSVSYGLAYRAAYVREFTLLERQAQQKAQRQPASNTANHKPAPAPSPESPTEQQIRQCANSQRAQHGLPPLAEDPVLDKAAHFHANNMLQYNFFDHTDPSGRGPTQRAALFGSGNLYAGVAENIAAGAPDVQSTCSEWMNSPGHRANILNPNYKTIGTGFARGGSGYHTYYVQDFGLPG